MMRAVIRPNLARKNTSVGIWNTSAIARTILMYSPNAVSSSGMNVDESFEKLAKNFHITGKTT